MASISTLRSTSRTSLILKWVLLLPVAPALAATARPRTRFRLRKSCLRYAISSIHLPGVVLTFTQIVWDTRCFNNKADWPADGSQPFVLSTGDNTGYALSDEALDGLLTIRSYGQYGDYVFGWKDTSLQKAMDEALGCMGASCGGLETQQLDDGNKCTVKRRVTEDHDGWMVSLPGMDGMPM
jgi:hypothetical protein